MLTGLPSTVSAPDGWNIPHAAGSLIAGPMAAAAP